MTDGAVTDGAATEITEDRFWDGRVLVRQRRRGYRFSVDAVLLAHAVATEMGGRPVRRILDLGTGCGIIPLLLAARLPEARIIGVEIQKPLADLARANVAENGFGDRVVILHRDLRELTRAEVGGPVDLVASNPPYRPPGTGRRCPEGERDIARREVHARLADVAAAARRMLDPGGRFRIVFPAERAAELMDRMREADLEPKSLRPVYSRAGEAARLVLAGGRRAGNTGLRLEAPLVIYGPDGEYAPEVAAMFRW
ncbi:MAG: tRNA1(Val) (adenine(37)-N6)-methyltransferase [Desulfococcaceae bacterium]